MYQTRCGLGCWGTGQVLLGSECRTPCSSSRRSQVCVWCTASCGITFGHRRPLLEVWCDANFAACQDTRRSTTGWVVVMYGGAVAWASKKQPTTAASTMEAAYQACGAVARKGLSLHKMSLTANLKMMLATASRKLFRGLCVTNAWSAWVC
jgi:hypothetical protein